MAADELIWKVKGRKGSYKIKSGMGGGHTPNTTEMNVNIANYKDVALFLYDLRFIWSVPIDKAIGEYKKVEGESAWPF